MFQKAPTITLYLDYITAVWCVSIRVLLTAEEKDFFQASTFYMTAHRGRGLDKSWMEWSIWTKLSGKVKEAQTRSSTKGIEKQRQQRFNQELSSGTAQEIYFVENLEATVENWKRDTGIEDILVTSHDLSRILLQVIVLDSSTKSPTTH